MIEKEENTVFSQKTRTAGIANLVGSALLLVYLAAFFICLYAGALNGGSEDTASGVGQGVALVVFLPLTLIGLIPICTVDLIWQLVFGVKYLQTHGNGKSFPSRGARIFSRVLKILSFCLLSIGVFLQYTVMSLGNNLSLAIVFSVATAFLAAYSIVLFVLEKKAQKTENK